MEINKLSDKNPLQAFIMDEQNINNYVFNNKRSEIDLGTKYKIGLVLGCNTYKIMEYRVLDAIDLYRRQVIEKLLVTGGSKYSGDMKDKESLVMRKYMLKKGVADSDIIVEDKSHNTYENMKYSISEIKKNCESDSKIAIITSDFHSKRAKAILEKMTDLEICSHGVLDGINDIDVWNDLLSSKIMIRKEALLLSLYVKNRIINDQEINPIYIKKR